MGRQRRFGDLEVSYDLEHERREWRAQRIAWSAMSLVAAAALAGLLGPGFLSNARAGHAGSPLRAEYQRFARYQAPAEWRLHCRPTRPDLFRISLDHSLLQGIEIEEIRPEPKMQIAGGKRTIFSFEAEEGGEQLVTLRFQSRTFGKVSGRIALEGAEPIEVRQFFWP